MIRLIALLFRALFPKPIPAATKPAKSRTPFPRRRASSTFFAFAFLVILAGSAHAAPLPEALKAAKPAPALDDPPLCRCQQKGFADCDCGEGAACRCVILDQYAHLPTKKECRAAMVRIDEWKRGLWRHAEALGYCSRVWCECDLCLDMPPLWTDSGGWHAKRLRDDADECDRLYRVWLLALSLHEEEPDDLPALEAELRGLIGDRAYVLGQLP